jgi:hypothetical protein
VESRTGVLCCPATPDWTLTQIVRREIFHPAEGGAEHVPARTTRSKGAPLRGSCQNRFRRVARVRAIQFFDSPATVVRPSKSRSTRGPKLAARVHCVQLPESPCATRETLLAGLFPPLPSCIFVHAILISVESTEQSPPHELSAIDYHGCVSLHSLWCPSLSPSGIGLPGHTLHVPVPSRCITSSLPNLISSPSLFYPLASLADPVGLLTW